MLVVFDFDGHEANIPIFLTAFRGILFKYNCLHYSKEIFLYRVKVNVYDYDLLSLGCIFGLKVYAYKD